MFLHFQFQAPTGKQNQKQPKNKHSGKEQLQVLL